jgi:hypothetical protein
MDSSLVPTVELGVAACACIEVARSTVPAFRKQLLADFSLPPGLLKYAEEQTVVSLAAVLKAIQLSGWTNQSFTDWGVVSGPRFLGREPLTRLLDKFRQQGALGTSPIVPAYLSLHAVSGTISMSLHIHGPNLGVGGSAGNTQEALLTGLAMQQEQSLPGVWVTASEWDPEPIPDTPNQHPEPVCRAVALALTPAAANHHGLNLRLVLNGNQTCGPAPTVADLVQFLANHGNVNRQGKWSCHLSGDSYLELTSAAAARSSRAA